MMLCCSYARWRHRAAPSAVLLGFAVLLAVGCTVHPPNLPAEPTLSSSPSAYWSVQPVTADGSVVKVEVAGTYEQIGYAFGQWYRQQGHLARPLTGGEQQTARGALAFYADVTPSAYEQLRGVYAAYGLGLDPVTEAIPVWEGEGMRILLPGLVELDSCSVIAARPEMAPDGHARLARNHDWPTALTDVFLVFAAPEQGYASVVITRGLPGLAASDGLHAAGLALGLASVSNAGYQWADPALPSNAAYRLVLEQCANVEEAIAMLRKIPVSFVNADSEQVITHILLADRSGASAVVEFLPQGVVVTRSEGPYQVMTNNYWAGPGGSGH
jgi:hypothetical protein